MGLGGGDQLRLRMSQRMLLSALTVSPMHPMLPDGVRNSTDLAEAVEAADREMSTAASTNGRVMS